MKRLHIIIYSLLMMVMGIKAQTCDLPISIAFESYDAEHLTEQTKQQIVNRLKQMLTQNGVAGDVYYSQFVMVPHISEIDKHILAGPPTKVALNLNVSLEIRELNEGVVLSAYSKDVNGVGNNEAKAYAQAVRQIGTGSSDAKRFIDGARSKIVSYYDRNSVSIMKKAQMLAATQQYDEALYHLMAVPECCNNYDQIAKSAIAIYQLRTDREGQQLLLKAQAIWAAGNNDKAAMQAAAVLVQIDPDATCYPEASKLLAEIKAKSSANAPWSFEMKKFEAAVDIQKQKIEAAKAIGMAYGNNQQPETTNLVFAK